MVAIFLAAHVLAADTLPGQLQQRIKRDRAKMKTVQKEISRGKQRVHKLKAEEATVVGGFERLNLQLNRSRKRQREILSEIEQIRARVDTLGCNREGIAQEIRRLETYAAGRLVAYYKLGGLGVAPILFSAESFFDLWQRRDTLERILADDARVWDNLQNQMERLDRVSEMLADEELKQKRLLASLKKEERAIAKKRTQRAWLLTQIRNQKDLALASVASLKKAAKELDEAIRSLERKPRPPSDRAAPKPGVFLALKGTLSMPVSGDLVGLFGPYVSEKHYNIKNFRKGVNFRANLGTPVRAVCNGQVIYADWFTGYGNIIIIDHGGHYYTLSAQLEQLFKKPGDTVRDREVIGTAGDTGTVNGRGLYFEIRHYGKPLDPVQWFKK
ncbi:MAG: peptidoglycan DD-metalloendopeptidase family protein [Desulfobacterales bacterium]|nr:peptidoglycan DD-metalloendopeptidase family protein [Desulfobacterales bacterium]